MKKYFLLTALVLVAIGLSGCTASSPAANQPAPSLANNATNNANVNTAAVSPTTVIVINPCSLVTQAEAESAFGLPAQAPVQNGTACRYDTVEKSKFFDLTAKSGTSVDFATMKNLCSSPAQPVNGLGETSCSANNTVVVLKNGVLMTLIAGGNFDQDQLRNLAVGAVSRIP